MTFMQTRGTGRTTKQLVDAKLFAIFVWCNNHLEYPKELLRKLSRIDVLVIGPNFLEQSEQFRGKEMIHSESFWIIR